MGEWRNDWIRLAVACFCSLGNIANSYDPIKVIQSPEDQIVYQTCLVYVKHRSNANGVVLNLPDH
ncbi:MAG: hypothetical protein O3B82_00875 [Bacteroidetes bacterium]|nr:hypothetical protein [Bacteroidota bacterium]